MTTTIYLDEYGFTGEDLNNSDQRFFTMASTIVGDEEAKENPRALFSWVSGQGIQVHEHKEARAIA